MQKTTKLKANSHLSVIHRNEKLNLYDAISDLQILVKQLEQQIEHTTEELDDKKICLSSNKIRHYIYLRDILYCEADSNYTRVFIRGRSPLLISKTLKTIEKEIDDTRFIRCHQSYLVNREHISHHDESGGSNLVLNQTIYVPVSRRLKRRVLNWINLYSI